MVIFIIMDTTTSIKPKTMAELLPGLSGILSKECIQTLTAKKKPRQTIAQTRSVEKVIKPLTIAEMRAEILALKVQSPRRVAQAATTSKKRTWNTSVKVDGKIVSRTANGQMNQNPVRKVLDFQPKPKPISNVRATMVQESPKFPKPEFRAKKALYLQGRNNVRISGISNIAETPLVNVPKMIPRIQITTANKENIPNQSIKKTAPPKNSHNKFLTAAPDTPKSNESNDDSFLQREKEINYEEEKRELAEQKREERFLENITECTPPASTPFKEYRSVKEFFHNSVADNSTMYHDNTIMCFEDQQPNYKENAREQSVIVSLCDLLNKASVNNSLKKNATTASPSQKISSQSEVEHLKQMVDQTEHYIKLIENSIMAFNKMKESQINHLESLRKLLKDKENGDKTLPEVEEPHSTVKNVTIETPKREVDDKPTPYQVSPVVKSTTKSPSYKIPRKSSCLRKKVFCKSLPNISKDIETPIRPDMGNRALSVYMKMKEHMNFLTTPVSTRTVNVLDTPALTSNNLQKQLDKLYEN